MKDLGATWARQNLGLILWKGNGEEGMKSTAPHQSLVNKRGQ